MTTQKKVYLVTELTLEQEQVKTQSGVVPFPTKKATTIMPKEVFAILQRYCTNTDTPKHRALYMFIIDGLRAAGGESTIPTISVSGIWHRFSPQHTRRKKITDH